MGLARVLDVLHPEAVDVAICIYCNRFVSADIEYYLRSIIGGEISYLSAMLGFKIDE